MFGSIFTKNLVVKRTTTPQFLVVLTYVLVAVDVRTLEFFYPDQYLTVDLKCAINYCSCTQLSVSALVSMRMLVHVLQCGHSTLVKP